MRRGVEGDGTKSSSTVPVGVEHAEEPATAPAAQWEGRMRDVSLI